MHPSSILYKPQPVNDGGDIWTCFTYSSIVFAVLFRLGLGRRAAAVIELLDVIDKNVIRCGRIHEISTADKNKYAQAND